MQVELKIAITYDENGTEFQEIEKQLKYAANHLASKAHLSGALNAVVDSWSCSIERKDDQ